MSDAADSLSNQILADAQKQAEPIRRRAAREAERIMERARQDAEQERQEIRRRTQETLQLRVNRMRARTEVEVQNIRRQATDDVLTAVRQRAIRDMAELTRSPGYADVLAGLALEAARQMDSRDLELVMRAEDRQSLGPQVAEAVRRRLGPRPDGQPPAVSVSDQTVPACGGLLVRNAGGRVFCDETFEARLRRMWDDLREELAAAMFGDAAGPPPPPAGPGEVRKEPEDRP